MIQYSYRLGTFVLFGICGAIIAALVLADRGGRRWLTALLLPVLAFSVIGAGIQRHEAPRPGIIASRLTSTIRIVSTSVTCRREAKRSVGARPTRAGSKKQCQTGPPGLDVRSRSWRSGLHQLDDAATAPRTSRVRRLSGDGRDSPRAQAGRAAGVSSCRWTAMQNRARRTSSSKRHGACRSPLAGSSRSSACWVSLPSALRSSWARYDAGDRHLRHLVAPLRPQVT